MLIFLLKLFSKNANPWQIFLGIIQNAGDLHRDLWDRWKTCSSRDKFFQLLRTTVVLSNPTSNLCKKFEFDSGSCLQKSFHRKFRNAQTLCGVSAIDDRSQRNVPLASTIEYNLKIRSGFWNWVSLKIQVKMKTDAQNEKIYFSKTSTFRMCNTLYRNGERERETVHPSIEKGDSS